MCFHYSNWYKWTFSLGFKNTPGPLALCCEIRLCHSAGFPLGYCISPRLPVVLINI